MGVEQIIGEATAKLNPKIFGRVPIKNAEAAIREAAEKAAKVGEEAVAKVTQELQAYKGKTMKEMAELTSQNDKIVLQTRAVAKAAIEAAQKQFAAQIKSAKAAARAPKVFEKILPNGGKEVRKVNANGATMVKEYNADGKLLKYSVTQLDGSIRRTTFDPITGKPVKTFTNVGGDKLIEYKEGSSSITKAVNKKKAKAEKPTLVSQTDPKRIFKSNWGNESGYEVIKTYSDGSKEVIQRFTEGNNNRVATRITDINGIQIEERILWENGTKRISLYNPDLRTKEIIEEYTLNNGFKCKMIEKSVYLPHEEIPTITRREYVIGEAKVTAKRIQDEVGMYTDKYKIKVTYPKETGKKNVLIKEGTEKNINTYISEIYEDYGKA